MKILITAAAIAMLAATPVLAQTNSSASGLNAPAPGASADGKDAAKGLTPNSTWYDGPSVTNHARDDQKSVNTTASALDKRAAERQARRDARAADHDADNAGH